MDQTQDGTTLIIKWSVMSGLLLIGALGCPGQHPEPVSRGDSTSTPGSNSVTNPIIGAAKQASSPSPLLARIELELRKVKPDIVNARLVSLVPAPAWGDTITYAVIAKGTGQHRGWKRIEDVGEIFGVFLVDSTLTRTSAPIDIFPSPRIGDYNVWLQRAWGSAVIVCAEGGSYGDGPMRREIQTEPDSGGIRKVKVDTNPGVPLAKMGDSSCGSSGPKGD